MIEIEEITDHTDEAAQAPATTKQERHDEQLRANESGAAETPAETAAADLTASQDTDEAVPGNSHEDLEVYMSVILPVKKPFRRHPWLQAVIAEAEQRKQGGNALFKQSRYTEAAVSRQISSST